ncbi:protein IQ-DOMAIN 19-like [Phragmites australis]|uniref:protein IQ-DOMAIN 19-like n=1 Tax=Phragmites australis TaxID=29695 RepID=UPI002D773189|nr:protein IQ-DOMAIN 19-like [Phragmites australis]XP_062231925.1 protein IQ-DOMAIN 19-like [Phragmites australis]
MGRAMRWLKKVLTGKKEGVRDHKEHHAACASGVIGPSVEKRRWSFAKPRNSVADGSRRPSVTTVAAGVLSQVRPCNCGQEREVDAVVMIQKAFRGYLARKALRALKSLVKLQALIRGYLVRKQADTTLRRLQALMKLQASSHALKTASSRKSIEQQRIVAQDARVKPLSLPVVHRRRLSDGGDSAIERSPRIVEMDTCHLRCRSSRITSRYAADSPGSSPLLYLYKPASRLQEHEPPHPKTTHNTPRLGAFPGFLGSPAKGGRAVSCRDAGSSPRYMADTASSVARTRCQSTPKQRHGAHVAQAPAPAEPWPSLSRSCSRNQARQLDSFSFKSSEASRVEQSEFSNEITRDYYLDRLW